MHARLDTKNSKKIQVHNCDGSFEFHSVHIRNQAKREYYKMFLRSIIYARWQNENTTTNKEGIVNIPSIGFRSFLNGFCSCCLNQKQRDCTNHFQVSLINALKPSGNSRQKKGISDAMKRCSCEGHRNLDYLTCHTSLASFISAVSCSQVNCLTSSGLLVVHLLT
jgi:hypothetical protein